MAGRGGATADTANVPSSAGVSELDLVRKGRNTCRGEKDAVRGIMGPRGLDDVAGVCQLQLLHKGSGVHCDGRIAMPCTVQAGFQDMSHQFM